MFSTVPTATLDVKAKSPDQETPDGSLARLPHQLVSCDNLTGAGVPAPLFIPELQPLTSAGAR